MLWKLNPQNWEELKYEAEALWAFQTTVYLTYQPEDLQDCNLALFNTDPGVNSTKLVIYNCSYCCQTQNNSCKEKSS